MSVKRVGGGCRYAERAWSPHPAVSRMLLSQEPEVSWLTGLTCRDDQGNEGARVVYSLAEWIERMQAGEISDAACSALYRKTCKQLKRGDEGLTYPEGFSAVYDAGWFRKKPKGIEQTNDLSRLGEQVILAAYEVTPAWQNLNDAGCFDHKAKMTPLGGHAVPIVAHGRIDKINSEMLVWVKCAWAGWGWRKGNQYTGIGLMTEKLHRAMNRELWVIV